MKPRRHRGQRSRLDSNRDLVRVYAQRSDRRETRAEQWQHLHNSDCDDSCRQCWPSVS